MRMAVNDHAWNDPPPVNFSESLSGSKRTHLNKRVAFPLSQSQAAVTVESQKAPLFALPPFVPIPIIAEKEEMPPLLLTENTQIPETNQQCSSELGNSESCVEYVSDMDMLSFIMSTFENVISKISHGSETRLDDIKNRINSMKEMWPEKISVAVRQKMFKLAKELSSGNHEAADMLHCSLMVDHVTEVKQWMVGVKHIIQISRSQMSPTVQMAQDS